MKLGRRRFLQASSCLLGGAGLSSSFQRQAWGDAASAAPDLKVTLRPRSMTTTLRAGGPAVEVLSYDGTTAGPVLRMKKGASLEVRLDNGLDTPTSLQWHGARCVNAVDGVFGATDAPIPPGGTATVRFTPPDSGLYWFHPAALPGRPDQTARGLRGVLLVEEPDAPATDLDLLVTVNDWQVGADRRSALTVNGGPGPQQQTIVSGGRLRLRVVNASTGRIMLAAIEGARPFIIAIDGQPSDLFEPVKDMVPIGPGARFEFLLDAPPKPGGTVGLKLRGTERVEGVLEADRSLLVVTTQGAAREPLPPIVALPRNPQLPRIVPLEDSVRADLVMETLPGASAAGQPRWKLNGTTSFELPDRPLLTVAKGGTVTFGFDNRSAEPVALRVHGHVMRLLHSKDDGWEPYWRDSVLLPPKSVSHVAFVADNPGRWLLESAFFDQAAFGLRTWFRVGG